MDNKLNDVTGTRYPIIQAPMFGVTTPAMVAAAGKAGALGSLPLGDLGNDQCAELIRTTRKLTGTPFAVNVFANEVPELTDELRNNYNRAKQFLGQLAAEYHFKVTFPEVDEIAFCNYRDQIDVLIAEKCDLVSFTFGIPDAESIARLKANGTILIGTCTSVTEALELEKSGVDVLCVQGLEAGGHRGSFATGDLPQIGGLSLLSQVYDSVRLPLIYAGGMYNARTVLAARALGAQAFQVGSLLLGSEESALQEFEKQRLRQAGESDIVLTRGFTGRYARGLRNILMKALEDSGNILPYPYQNKLTGILRKAARQSANTDFLSLWAGQSLHDFPGKSTASILEALIFDIKKADHEF